VRSGIIDGFFCRNCSVFWIAAIRMSCGLESRKIPRFCLHKGSCVLLIIEMVAWSGVKRVLTISCTTLSLVSPFAPNSRSSRYFLVKRSQFCMPRGYEPRWKALSLHVVLGTVFLHLMLLYTTRLEETSPPLKVRKSFAAD
jgi:hypothetical protein